jgi:adenylate cyclase
VESRDAHTFVFADIAGFTALTEAHGDERAADLVGRFCDEVAPLVTECQGEQIKSIGDAILVRFSLAGQALLFGLRVVSEIGGRHAFPIVRVGMHTGPAVERDGDWFGSTVNLAARVAGAADGGEVLLTQATRDSAGAVGGVELDLRGAHRFRHVPQPTLILRARPAGVSPATLPIDPVCRMAVEPERSRRVLFENEDLHFCSTRCAVAFAASPELYVDVRGTALSQA